MVSWMESHFLFFLFFYVLQMEHLSAASRERRYYSTLVVLGSNGAVIKSLAEQALWSGRRQVASLDRVSGLPCRDDGVTDRYRGLHDGPAHPKLVLKQIITRRAVHLRRRRCPLVAVAGEKRTETNASVICYC